MKYLALVLTLEAYTVAIGLMFAELPPIAYALPFAFVICIAFVLWLCLFAFIAISPRDTPPIDD